MPYKDPKKKKEHAKKYQRQYKLTPVGREIAQRAKKAQGERRRDILRQLKSVPCADCGVKYPPCVMDFDHRDPKEKVRGVANMTSVAAILKEAEKCDVVCANCHRLRTWKGTENANRSDI